MADRGAKRRLVTLTGRPPVTIDEDEWPMLARARWVAPKGRWDETVSRQHMTVRTHRDGRALVYATSENTEEPPVIDRRAGEVLSPPVSMAQIRAAVERVGKEVQARPELVMDLYANFPPEKL